jgi:hypothetical protein
MEEETPTALRLRDDMPPVPGQGKGRFILLGTLAIIGAAVLAGVELYFIALLAASVGGLGFIMGLVKPGSMHRRR